MGEVNKTDRSTSSFNTFGMFERLMKTIFNRKLYIKINRARLKNNL